MSLSRFFKSCAIVGACCATRAAAAAPNEGTAQCLEAYADGQRARKAGSFAEARELFAHCGGRSCPAALHGDCQGWLEEVEAATPTSVFRVIGAKGQELTEARVSVDGGPEQPLTGRALAFDPGKHQLRFEAPGHRAVTQQFTFAEGEKLTPREIRLQPIATSLGGDSRQEASPSSSAGAAPLWPTWLGLGLGAAGAAGFVYFGLDARERDRSLSSCSPHCPESRVERVERGYVMANVSLGVGIAGVLGAATWLLLRPNQEPNDASTSVGLSWYLGPHTWGVQGRF